MQTQQHAEPILDLIKANKIIEIVAPTGSGKSIGVPAILAAAGLRAWNVVPTRTAAKSLYEYQKILQADNIKPSSVGYAAEGTKDYTDKTLIVYATSGHVRRKMLKYFRDGMKPQDFCDVLICDEAHNGSLDLTVIIALWNYAFLHGVPTPKLVLASATPVTSPFDSVRYEIKIPSLPVDIIYGDQNYDIGNSLFKAAADLAVKLHNTEPVTENHILIFAPGLSEVERIKEEVGFLNNAVIIDIYGALNQDEIVKIYNEVGPTIRKIIISTNIAETAITIPNIGIVIDTLTEKRIELSPSGGKRLVVGWISKDSADQRKGRTGRTRAGKCYRVCTEEFYGGLDRHRVPEIDRVPIYDIIMELLDVGLKPGAVLSLNEERINKAVAELERLGMVSQMADIITVNDSGHFAVNFPIAVRNAALLYKWINFEGLRFPDNIIKDAQKLGLNYQYLEVAPKSIIYSLLPYQTAQIGAAFEQYLPFATVKVIVDATANIGCDTINFRKMYPLAQIVAVEKDPATASILARNVKNISKIVGSEIDSNIVVIKGSAADNMFPASFIYFDPPWDNGLMIDDYPLNIYVDKVLKEGYSQHVVVKLPPTYKLELTNGTMSKPVVIKKPDGSAAYQLVFVKNKNPVLKLETINKPSLRVYPRVYHPYPGIVATCLIDNWGQGYFWTPRREVSETPKEYKIRISKYRERYFGKYRGYNDLETALNLWTDMAKYTELTFEREAVSQWCKDNSINHKKIVELLKVIKQCMVGVQGVNPVMFTTMGVMVAIRPMIEEIYNDRIFVKKGKTYIDLKNGDSYMLDSNNAINGFKKDEPEAVVALNISEISKLTSVTRLVSFAVETKKPKVPKPDLRPDWTRLIYISKIRKLFKPTQQAIVSSWLQGMADENEVFTADKLKPGSKYTQELLRKIKNKKVVSEALKIANEYLTAEKQKPVYQITNNKLVMGDFSWNLPKNFDLENLPNLLRLSSLYGIKNVPWNKI